jgi:hypothetical protein
MTITLAQIEAMISAVESFPLKDVTAIINNPDIDNTEKIIKDVISVISVAYPQAAVATYGLEAIVWIIKHPGANLNTNQDPLGRGGRRA